MQKGVQAAVKRKLTAPRPGRREARLEAALQQHRLGVPGHRLSARATSFLDMIKTKVPPRVMAAVLRLWHKGWCTSNRFGGNGKCMYGCDALDSTTHYACCPKIWEFAHKRLRCTPAIEPAVRRRTFMALDRNWRATDPHDAVITAVLIYAAYKAHNTWRNSGRVIPAAPGLLRQAIHEAVRGYPDAQATIDNIWAAP